MVALLSLTTDVSGTSLIYPSVGNNHLEITSKQDVIGMWLNFQEKRNVGMFYCYVFKVLLEPIALNWEFVVSLCLAQKKHVQRAHSSWYFHPKVGYPLVI